MCVKSFWKRTQRKTYDLLSYKYSLVIFLLTSTVAIVAVIQFGEVWVVWSRDRYEAVFSPFSDNIAGKSLQHQLCQGVPIDVVYTWVNGSDPDLLKQLAAFKQNLLEETSQKCPYAHCVPSHIITARTWLAERQLLPGSVSWEHWADSYSHTNWTLIGMRDTSEAARVVCIGLVVEDENVTLHQAHWTTDPTAPNTYAVPNALVLENVPLDEKSERGDLIHNLLLAELGVEIKHLWSYHSKQLLVASVATKNDAHRLLQASGHFHIEENIVNVSKAFLILELPSIGQYKDFEPSRFEDKEELRYSLRSLEQYAPWVRHVYLVTNGQLPSWLDLDHPRLTLVTHTQLFSDPTHLPTFSSPAIESHLHRIPGLSKNFLYFNDDVMLGSEVWPEDFITHAGGQKVYLSWPVPDCTESCPWTWVGDGSCDVTCNTTECSFDGGDCETSHEDVDLPENMSPWRALADDARQELDDAWNDSADVGEREPVNKKVIVRQDTPSRNTSASLNINGRRHKKALNHRNKNWNIAWWQLSTSYLHNATINITEKLKEKLPDHSDDQLTVASVNRKMHVPHSISDMLINNRPNKSVSVIAHATARQPRDTFAESLLYVNRLLNQEYGFEARKVPAHMPHLVNREVMEQLQERFHLQWQETSSHRVRSVRDMQFAFSYFYFLISEKNSRSVADIFAMFDTDRSGTWSDREIRTLLTRIYELPLSYDEVLHFDSTVANCSPDAVPPPTPPYERYHDSKLPVVSSTLVQRCDPLARLLLDKFGHHHKYHFEVVRDRHHDVTFKMLSSNLSVLVTQLDDIRRHPKKFICLNDNLDSGHMQDRAVVRAVLQDLYESLLPAPSSFELPPELRNRFQHVSELQAWRTKRSAVKMVMYLCMLMLLAFTVSSFLQSEWRWLQRKVISKRHQTQHTGMVKEV